MGGLLQEAAVPLELLFQSLESRVSAMGRLMPCVQEPLVASSIEC